MIITQTDILDFMSKEFSPGEEQEQLNEFFLLIGKLFSNIQPPIALPASQIQSILASDSSLSFSLGTNLFTKCFEKAKKNMSPNVPPAGLFILTPPINPNPTNNEVASHIATLISLWVLTGQNPSGSPLSII